LLYAFGRGTPIRQEKIRGRRGRKKGKTRVSWGGGYLGENVSERRVIPSRSEVERENTD